jgi:MFS family permease
VAAYLPHVLIAPLGGVLADRHDRRLVMLAADAGAAAATAALVLCALAGVLTPGRATVLVAASAACNAVQWPAYEAAAVALVSAPQLGRASGLLELSRGATQLLAPVLGGALFASGLDTILAIDLASFAVGLAAVGAIRIPPHARGNRDVRGWLAELGDAWDVIAGRPGLCAALALFATTNFTFAVSEIAFRPLVLDGGEPWQLGLLLSTVGIGMVTGAIVMAAWGGPARKAPAIFAFQLVEGAALVAAGASTGLAGRCAAAFAYGVVIPLTFGCARIVWQTAIPGELQGRVTALRNALVMVAIPLGYAAASPIHHVLAPRFAIVAMGGLTWLAALGAFTFAPYRRVELEVA